MTFYKYSKESISRINQLPENKVIEFIDRIHPKSLTEIFKGLDRIYGFRRGSKMETKEQKNRLAKRISTKKLNEQSEKDYIVLFNIWHIYAQSIFRDPENTKKYFFEKFPLDRKNNESTTTDEAEEIDFEYIRRLKDKITNNEFAKEDVDDFILFSPFPKVDKLKKIIKDSKDREKINSELALNHLPEEFKKFKSGTNKSIKNLQEKIDSLEENINDKNDNVQKNISFLKSKIQSHNENIKSEIKNLSKSLYLLEKNIVKANEEEKKKLDKHIKKSEYKYNDIRTELNSIIEKTDKLEKENIQHTVNAIPINTETKAEEASLIKNPIASNIKDIDVVDTNTIEDTLPVLTSNIELLGINRTDAKNISASILTALACGQIIFFYGEFSSIFSRIFSCMFSPENSFEINIPVGLLQNYSFSRYFNRVIKIEQIQKSINLINANLSPIEVYGNELINSSNYSLFTNKATGNGVFTFGSIDNSPGSIPVSDTYFTIGACFNLSEYISDNRLFKNEFKLSCISMSKPLLEEIKSYEYCKGKNEILDDFLEKLKVETTLGFLASLNNSNNYLINHLDFNENHAFTILLDTRILPLYILMNSESLREFLDMTLPFLEEYEIEKPSLIKKYNNKLIA